MSEKTQFVEMKRTKFVKGQVKVAGQIVEMEKPEAQYFINNGFAVETKSTKETAAPKAKGK